MVDAKLSPPTSAGGTALVTHMVSCGWGQLAPESDVRAMGSVQ
ncbi:hypothetical protein OH768_38995 [Streptomyces sp. NBC_01622]|nr:hypothetical protein OH768_38995 [Streptomyces sp. NBC_01622]